MRKSEGVAFTVWLNDLVKNEIKLIELMKLYDSDNDTEYVNGLIKGKWSI
jgi:hypothetical protein